MGDGPGTPLIVIHGGPGSGSYSPKPFGALGDERPVGTLPKHHRL